jgi:hypothetical protein
LLSGANDRARNRKRDNYASDKSRMHLQNPFEKTASVTGMRRKLPRNFCKAKRNSFPDVRAARAGSKLAGQLFERLIVFEFGDVVDGRSRDVQ